MKNKNPQFSKSSNVLIFAGLIAILGIGAVLFPWNILNGMGYGHYHIVIDKYHDLGSFIYGISVPFLTVATVILLWRTYSSQNEQLQDQKESIAKQRFEDMFFHLIESHNSIVNSLDFQKESTPNYRLQFSNLRSRSGILSQPDAPPTITYTYGRDCLKTLMLAIGEYFEPRSDKSLKSTLAIYHSLQDKNKGDLHHYFRFIYRVLKFVDEAEGISDKEKYNFAGIFRALFSPYELALIFYNGLHHYGKEKLKPLLEKYSFFKNLDEDPLISTNHLKYYHAVAYADWNGQKRKKNLADWEIREVVRLKRLKSLRIVLLKKIEREETAKRAKEWMDKEEAERKKAELEKAEKERLENETAERKQVEEEQRKEAERAKEELKRRQKDDEAGK